MIHHPETRKDEIFVGNRNIQRDNCDEFTNASIKFRLGNVAYFLDGTEMKDSKHHKPVFIHEDSFKSYDKHQNDKLKKIRGR